MRFRCFWEDGDVIGVWSRRGLKIVCVGGPTRISCSMTRAFSFMIKISVRNMHVPSLVNSKVYGLWRF